MQGVVEALNPEINFRAHLTTLYGGNLKDF